MVQRWEKEERLTEKGEGALRVKEHGERAVS